MYVWIKYCTQIKSSHIFHEHDMAFSTKVEIIKQNLNNDGQQFHQYARGELFLLLVLSHDLWWLELSLRTCVFSNFHATFPFPVFTVVTVESIKAIFANTYKSCGSCNTRSFMFTWLFTAFGNFYGKKTIYEIRK